MVEFANDGANFTDTQAPRIFANTLLYTVMKNMNFHYAVDYDIMLGLTFGDATPNLM